MDYLLMPVAYILWSILLIVWAIQFYTLRKKRSTRQIHSLHSFSWHLSRYLFTGMLCIVWITLFFPSWWVTQKSENSSWVDIMVMLDVSKSMRVRDMEYQKNYRIDRLTTAKNLVSKLVHEGPEHRWWLGVFAGEAIGISPLTHDTNLFLTFLQGIDENNVTIGGTNITQALQVWIDRFEVSETTRWKVLILISDGGEESLKIPQSLQQRIKEEGIFVVTVWVGTSDGGAIPEGKDIRWDTTYKSQQGQYVVSKFNPRWLQTIATTLQGEFFHITSIQETKKILNSFWHIETSALENVWGTKPRSLVPYLLFLSLFLFLGYLLCYLDETWVKNIWNRIRLLLKTKM